MMKTVKITFLILVVVGLTVLAHIMSGWFGVKIFWGIVIGAGVFVGLRSLLPSDPNSQDDDFLIGYIFGRRKD